MASSRSGVYVIRHVASGRRYVGSAVNIGKRWKEHLRGLSTGKHHSRFLQRAWDKHGQAAFAFEVALYCDRGNLLMYEQALIDFYKPEFNSAPTAGSQLGFKMSDAAKAKMSVAAKRTRNFTGHRHSEESKRRISEAKRGVRPDAETVAKRKAGIAKLPIPPAGRNFSAHQARQIRLRLSSGERQRVLCREFGVSDSTISEIKTRKSYGWVK